ncbi:MAG: peptidoglycan DD-metalloendopeptidase family protein [candidate division Zixibacteria bacterium]
MIKITLYIVAIFSFFGITSAFADDDNSRIQDNKKELDDLKQQISHTRNKIDSLQNIESSISKTISSYGDNVSRNRTLVNRMGQELRTVRGELAKNKQDLILTEDRLRRIKEGYVGLLKDYYIHRRSGADYAGWDFEMLLSKNRLSRYLASISNVSTREIIMADDSVRRLTDQVDSLSRQGSQINRMREEKKSKINLDLALKEKEEKSLSIVRQQTNMMRDRYESLSEMAQQMEEIIAQLEREQEQKRLAGKMTPRFASGSFASLKGRINPPIKGRIVSTFGWKVNKTTNLKSFSPGIDIDPGQGHKDIHVVAPGRVAYVGNLRGYSNFVIIEHDDGYYTTYAGMISVTVETDDIVLSGDKLGVCGNNNIHFELRRGREHLDPVVWLNLDEF